MSEHVRAVDRRTGRRRRRAGVLRTAHGDVPTPAFMPVGTKATVKTLDPDELRAVGATIVLGNTYHLHFRPGEDLIAELGGLHRFMGWDGPILTDSGGFQVFSLRDTLLEADDDGVTFRSVYDGSPERFTPELAAAIQRALGSDIAMCLDICPPAGVTRASSWRRRCAGRPSGRSASATSRAPRGSSASGSRRAPPTPSCAGARSRRSPRSASTASRSAASAWGRTGTRCSRRSPGRRRSSRPDGPRYFMGIGDPEGILRVIEAGVDMFDCVLPTRTARTGSALTWEGRLNLRNQRFARDPRPLDESCACSACTRFSRAYIRHLINQQELLGLRLLSVHNLRFLLDLTAGARTAIERGALPAYVAEALARLAQAPEEDV